MRKTTKQLQMQVTSGEKLVMVTCYDATFARLVEKAEVDMILIGDSLGMVIQGHEHTIPVTLDEMIYHCRAVARGSSSPHLVGDLPFGTYQGSTDEAVSNAFRLMKEGHVQSVKLEGGAQWSALIKRLTGAGVPVVGHLGLTPQSVHQLGGYRIQGRDEETAIELKKDALALQAAGCFAIVFEGVPATLAAEITQMLDVPTIGIGAGAACDGQVLVLYDLLGLDERFNPKFLKKYAQLHSSVVDAVSTYAAEVREGHFPALSQSHQ